MKSKLYKLFHPINALIYSGPILIIFSLIYLNFFQRFNETESYILYLIMTYSLVIVIIKLYNVIKIKINRIIDNNKYLFKLKNDYELRYKISLYIALGINILYSIFKFVLGICYKSLWFIAFSLYYLLLVIIRASIVKKEINDNNTQKNEWLIYRKSAIILLFMNVILALIILVIVNDKIIIKYPMYIAIAIACYTFYITIASIINLIKYHKFKSPMMSASKVINIITNLISMLSLEVVMLSTFGADKVEFNEIMIMASGGFFSVIIITICLYMIIKSTERTNNIK